MYVNVLYGIFPSKLTQKHFFKDQQSIKQLLIVAVSWHSGILYTLYVTQIHLLTFLVRLVIRIFFNIVWCVYICIVLDNSGKVTT